MPTSAKRRGIVNRLYIGKSTFFKIFLLVGVALISAIFIWYTFEVIEELERGTRSQVNKYVKMWQLAASSPISGQELQFIFEEIIVKADFPIIVLNENGEPIHWRNIAGVTPDDTSPETLAHLRAVAQQMIDNNRKIPLEFGEGRVSYFCYGDTYAIELLTLMPFIEIGIVVAFLLVAFIGFQNIRRSEERHIWVGMAKETAHQLGTPITSLLGWIEIMEGETRLAELSKEDSSMLQEALTNMRVDSDRLQRIANRFGQIGSTPDLQPYDLNRCVRETVEYYRRRLPFEGKGIAIDLTTGELPRVNLNPELFSWALENIIKNSLQVVDSKSGRIDVRTEHQPADKYVTLEIEDNGPGISAAAARKIFRAGFTTKKRGWGLGLTLAKRIIEEYHAGRVGLKKSRPGQTVMEIQLPAAAGK